MSSGLATAFFLIGIIGLFVLDWDSKSRTSKALWIPTIWLLLASSRPVSLWLQIAPQSQTPDQYLDGSPLDRGVFLCLLACGIVVLIGRNRQVYSILAANWPILLFFGYCAISVVWSDYPEVAFKRWVKATGDVIAVLVVLTERNPRAAIERVLARGAFLLIPISILLIKYYGDIGRAYSPWDGNMSYTGVTTTKNALGMLTMILALGAFWRCLRAWRLQESTPSRKLIAQLTVLAMASWLFWRLNSMTSLACFVFSALLMTVVMRRAKIPSPAVHIAVISAVLLAIFVLFVSPVLLSALGRNPTLTGRTDIWSLVLQHRENALVGAGFESFWLGPRLDVLWRIYWFHINQSHNGYIDTFLNLGLLGLGCLAILLGNGYAKVLRQLPRDRAMGALLLSYFVVAIIYNLTETAFKTLNLIWIVLLLAIITVPRMALVRNPLVKEKELVERDSMVEYESAVTGGYV